MAELENEEKSQRTALITLIVQLFAGNLIITQVITQMCVQID